MLCRAFLGVVRLKKQDGPRLGGSHPEVSLDRRLGVSRPHSVQAMGNEDLGSEQVAGSKGQRVSPAFKGPETYGVT